MNQISADIVEKTWKKVGATTPQDAPKLMTMRENYCFI